MTWREDKNLLVLCFMVVFFTFVTFVATWFWREDGQVFATFAGPLGVFVGALAMMLKADKALPPPGTTTASTASQQQTTTTPQAVPYPQPESEIQK
jgi:hypothetical protein